MNTGICGECGSTGTLAAFADETHFIADTAPVHGLSGKRCSVCGEVYFDEASSERFSNACDAWVLARRAEERDMLRRVRKRLGLTQQQAARLTGGGHNAFSRYERGEASPMAAVVNLFKLLDKHPELLEEIRP